MNYRQLNGKSIREGFIEFHRSNPHVYKAFEKQVLLAIERGRKKVSAKLIINWIRWNEYLEKDKNFKINDAYQAYFARLFVAMHPEIKDQIFEMRKLRNEEPGPYMKVDKNGQISFL